jgi:hypothetical protein
MILLESHDRFDELVELEPTTGQLRWYSKQDSPNMAARPIHGSFSQLDAHRVFLYRQTDVLHLRVDDTDVELTDDAHVELVRGDTNVLTVVRSDVPILCLEYKPYVADEIDRWRMYMSPFIEEEHFDFGLFVWEVTQNADRRSAIYR